MNDDNQQSEFQWFETLQARLVQTFLADGYNRQRSEELGFLLAQAVRNVPPLLSLLEEAEQHSTDEMMDAVHAVLANRHALEQANKILLDAPSARPSRRS
jgi:uncharacterized protein YecA (UPF0149 family)